MGEILNLKSIENHGTVKIYSAFSSTISYKFPFLNFLIIAKLNRIKKKKPNRGCKKKNKMCYSTTQVCRCNEETRTNSNETSLIGQPLFDTETNTLYIGDGEAKIKELQPITNLNAGIGMTINVEYRSE